MSMKTVQIEYAVVSPAVLERVVQRVFPNSFISWKDVCEEYFEFTVIGVKDLASLENILAKYV